MDEAGIPSQRSRAEIKSWKRQLQAEGRLVDLAARAEIEELLGAEPPAAII